MLSKSNLEEILHVALSTGGDFADIFIEDANGTIVACEDNKIERITTGNSHGAGVRVIKNKVISYSSTSKVTLSELKKTAKQAASAFSGSAMPRRVAQAAANSRSVRPCAFHDHSAAAVTLKSKSRLSGRTWPHKQASPLSTSSVMRYLMNCGPLQGQATE